MKIMKAQILLIENNPEEAEVWMQRESGVIFIVHPLFIHDEGQFKQVGFAIDDNVQKIH